MRLWFLNSESGAISWSSKLQTTVSTSTAEAEAMSLFAASQEHELLRSLANEIGIDMEKPTKVHVENQACIAITKITVNSEKVKHSAIKLSFIQEKLEMRHLDVEFCPNSEKIAADLLTKLLAKVEGRNVQQKTLRRIYLVIELRKGGVLKYKSRFLYFSGR